MKKIKNVIVCGLGAVGCVYAEKLKSNSNINLKILVDDKRLKKYKNTPRTINGKVIEFEYITENCQDFKADLIIFATKNGGFNDVLKLSEKFISHDTIFMSLLNGLFSEDILEKKFDKKNVLFSYYLGHTIYRKENDISFDYNGKIFFSSSQNDPYSLEVQSVKDIFDQSQIEYEICKDIQFSRWKKFIFNIGFNQASAILKLPFKYFQNDKKCFKLAFNLMSEAIEIAKRIGVNLPDDFEEQIVYDLSMMLPNGKTSMLQDIEGKRKTELDIFCEYIIKFGEKLGIDTPYNKIAKEIIEAIESSY